MCSWSLQPAQNLFCALMALCTSTSFLHSTFYFRNFWLTAVFTTRLKAPQGLGTYMFSPLCLYLSEKFWAHRRQWLFVDWMGQSVNFKVKSFRAWVRLKQISSTWWGSIGSTYLDWALCVSVGNSILAAVFTCPHAVDGNRADSKPNCEVFLCRLCVLCFPFCSLFSKCFPYIKTGKHPPLDIYTCFHH